MLTARDLFKHLPLSTRFLDHGGQQDQVNRRERQARAQTQQLAILTPDTLTNTPLRLQFRQESLDCCHTLGRVRHAQL